VCFKQAPSIVFIDELDALCARRDDGASALQRRLVATLLTLMDGLNTSAGVCVIGATNRPHALDAAIRRPGRLDRYVSSCTAHIFSMSSTHLSLPLMCCNTIKFIIDTPDRYTSNLYREVEMPVPSAAARREILACMLGPPLSTPSSSSSSSSGVPHRLTSAAIAGVANTLHGYVGADIAALVSEAALLRLGAADDDGNDDYKDDGGVGGAASGGGAVLCVTDLERARLRVRPSTMRSTELSVPLTTWADVGGQADVKQRLREAVEWPLNNAAAFERLGVAPPKGVLLYGPPGCSKTLMAKAVANECQQNFLAVQGPELLSKWVGDSEKAVRDVFRRARAAAPAIIFFDELDSIGTARSGGSGGGGGGEGNAVADRVLSQLLIELDGVVALKQVTVIAATNRPDMLDAALLRPGRIDRSLYVAPPDAESAADIYSVCMRKMAVAADVDATSLGARSVGMSGAEVAAVCREAALRAMADDVAAPAVAACHFDAAIAHVRQRPSITPAMLAYYERFAAGQRGSSV
jgi:AAA family ATPase